MTKEEMITLLRSVGCNENTITGMGNAFDIGMEVERERVENILCAWMDDRKNIATDLLDIMKDIQNGVRY